MIRVKKLDGMLQEYNEGKLRASLANAGASEETIAKILPEVRKTLHDGMETRTLYAFVLKEFKRLQPHISSRYTLKSAILRLGPEGFAFEEYVSHIFQARGYTTRLNRLVRGQHITHEIDIAADRGSEHLMIECKHHMKPWIGCPIQTALYVYARFLDVKREFTRPMLVTNTKFSPQLLAYSKGVGLWLMGWKYPSKDSLERNIEQFRLYPVTMLHSLPREGVGALLARKIVLVRSLAGMTPEAIAEAAAINLSRARRIHAEASALCPRA